MELSGFLSYLVFFGILAGIYGVLSLGLNLQWGFTGLFNIGVAGFFAIGAYASAILTKPPSPEHLGGFSLPFPLGLAGAALAAGGIAYLVGRPTLRLREDYLAIATIGIAETIRLIFKSEAWLTYGTRGIRAIPQPLHSRFSPHYDLFYLLLVVVVIAFVYLAIERLIENPWGRTLRAIREDEVVAAAAGKEIFHFKMQALVLGSAVMGLAGALYAHYVRFISPESFEPMRATFLIWVMLIVGGSGNNRGALVGSLVVWAIWTGTEFLTDLLPEALETRAGYLRVIIIGLLLQAILLRRPRGLLPERKATGP